MDLGIMWCLTHCRQRCICIVFHSVSFIRFLSWQMAYEMKWYFVCRVLLFHIWHWIIDPENLFVRYHILQHFICEVSITSHIVIWHWYQYFFVRIGGTIWMPYKCCWNPYPGYNIYHGKTEWNMSTSSIFKSAFLFSMDWLLYSCLGGEAYIRRLICVDSNYWYVTSTSDTYTWTIHCIFIFTSIIVFKLASIRCTISARRGPCSFLLVNVVCDLYSSIHCCN